MANQILSGGIGSKSSLYALLIDRYNGRWLTGYLVVKQKVNHPSFLY